MQGKIRRQRNLLFSTKFPGKNLEGKSVCMGNEGNTGLNAPVETKETKATMYKLFISNSIQCEQRY
jgi:hypothetical protein